MAFDAGIHKPVVYTFTGGSITVYASNLELAELELHLLNVLASEDGGSSKKHTASGTKHRTLGALVSVTLP